MLVEVLRRAFPIADTRPAFCKPPGQHEEWEFSERPMLGLPLEFGEGPPWRILATCPDQ
ncbi:hypothetical protein SSOG_07249 [Streptomyces himastatinicus ATCC 53653]|uniref:Uncharacterized protein n=1 Tax=Streptomyces himastatinicus ATCC 53653 TaxID=457427 RepID=D9WH55_9ACTN|nr:hypothetical protein SSOG_07249 [Streptomyces himastatinicus ATCC 53653]